ncbi:hypothetical protein C7377_0835 [Balneicella halophila]|uniref:Extracellular endo-alpha-(1->5)-L-arabinanase C-terminal domain-containing protein n=1 Tax=Balneicella halophila TaxID=1537566 RepID=A0A7L4USS6_BALHA|nr:hypothetical protein [Balneicella halophila]PVX52511.1 hypothetical protein C7377_0835 [Balneicella halophila]
MKNSLILLLIIIYGTGLAQDTSIIGEWRLTTMRKGNKEKKVNSGIIFEKGGVLKLGLFNMGEIIEAGKWEYNSKNKTIKMSSKIDSNLNDIGKIITISDSI